jgi:hypothetical protein
VNFNQGRIAVARIASIDITLKHYAHALPEDDKTLAAGIDRMFG